MHSKKELKKRYDENVERYREACLLAKTIMGDVLRDAKIELLHISHRVKAFESMYEKISRKKYNDAYGQVEDIAGVRVICFYMNDLTKIARSIEQAFVLSESIDKIEYLEEDQFGYRSNHFVVTLPHDVAPQELWDYKIEIQTRTVLMHAWAHIQGRLEYKQSQHTPKKFRRKLFQMSALLEMADEQFQSLKIEKDAFRASLITTRAEFTPHIELNIDTFMSFLEMYFPGRKESYRFSKLLMKELLQCQMNFDQILTSYERVENFLPEIEENLGVHLRREDMLKVILAVTSTSFQQHFSEDELLIQHQEVIQKWRERF